MGVFGLPDEIDRKLIATFREAATTFEASKLAYGNEGHPWAKVQVVALAAAAVLAKSGHADADSAHMTIAIRACEMWLPTELWNDDRATQELVNDSLYPLITEMYEAASTGSSGRVEELLAIPFQSFGAPGHIEAQRLSRFMDSIARPKPPMALLVLLAAAVVALLVWLL